MVVVVVVSVVVGGGGGGDDGGTESRGHVVDFSQDPRPDPSGCVQCCVRVPPHSIRGHGGHTHTVPTTPLYIF